MASNLEPNAHVEAWAYIEETLDAVLKGEVENMGTRGRMYTAVYDFCVAPRPQVRPPTMYGGSRTFFGEDLYENLKNHLTKHLVETGEKAKSHTDEALLSFYIQEWDRYVEAAGKIDRWFNYLNRHWLRRTAHSFSTNVYDVYTLLFIQWNDVLVPKLSRNVMAAVLKMVERQRNGAIIQSSLIESNVHTFLALGLKLPDSRESDPELYRDHLERPLLEATNQYYKAKTEQYGPEMTAVEFLRTLETRMDDEKHFVGRYLHPGSVDRLIKACVRVPVDNFSDRIQREFQMLVENERHDDLVWMLRLLSMTRYNFEALQDIFEVYARNSGHAALEKVVVLEGRNPDLKGYVDALSGVLIKLEKFPFVIESSGFARSFYNAAKEFVNYNKFCETGSTRSPELLAKYADKLLKSGKSTADAGLETSRGQVMKIFYNVADKDAFLEFYSKMLAKRLINSSSSVEAELSMVRRLTKVCGVQATSNLQCMLDDIHISGDLSSGYNSWQGNASNRDERGISYQILNSFSWPVTLPTTAFTPPSEIVNNHTSFEDYYLDKHCGRKLTWLWNACKGEVEATYIRDTKTPYTFMVSAYQLAILTLFNETDIVTYSDAQTATALSAALLNGTLSMLVKAKVIIPTNPDHDSDPAPSEKTSYTLNYDFKSKHSKVNLNFAIIEPEQQQKTREETEETKRIIQSHRQGLTEAALVRIMKSSKTMTKVDLVQAAIAEFRTGFFVPMAEDVEKSIGMLVEKGYLELLEDGEVVGYLA